MGTWVGYLRESKEFILGRGKRNAIELTFVDLGMGDIPWDYQKNESEREKKRKKEGMRDIFIYEARQTWPKSTTI